MNNVLPFGHDSQIATITQETFFNLFEKGVTLTTSMQAFVATVYNKETFLQSLPSNYTV